MLYESNLRGHVQIYVYTITNNYTYLSQSSTKSKLVYIVYMAIRPNVVKFQFFQLWGSVRFPNHRVGSFDPAIHPTIWKQMIFYNWYIFLFTFRNVLLRMHILTTIPFTWVSESTLLSKNSTTRIIHHETHHSNPRANASTYTPITTALPPNSNLFSITLSHNGLPQSSPAAIWRNSHLPTSDHNSDLRPLPNILHLHPSAPTL